MVIEVLFPEICNLYGDLANVTYLKESAEALDIVETHLNDVPLFVQAQKGAAEMPVMVYMGTTTERGQKLVIEKLTEYIDIIKKCIDDGVNFLITGNALEIFGNEIIEEGNLVCEGLGILDIRSERKSVTRYNSLYVGEFETADKEGNIRIVGFKSVFGLAYGPGIKNKAFNTLLGYGTNEEAKEEGFRINNFIATYVTGPLMVLNPIFAKWYLRKITNSDIEPAFWDAAMDAYNSRLEEYLAPGKGWKY